MTRAYLVKPIASAYKYGNNCADFVNFIFFPHHAHIIFGEKCMRTSEKVRLIVIHICLLAAIPGSAHPKLEPFGPGQVYNKSKSLQVHVLPAAQPN